MDDGSTALGNRSRLRAPAGGSPVARRPVALAHHRRRRAIALAVLAGGAPVLRGVEEGYFHAGTSGIVASGFPIGDHTETHAPMSQLSRKQQQAQLLEETSRIGDYGAPFPRLFRPPYGL